MSIKPILHTGVYDGMCEVLCKVYGHGPRISSRWLLYAICVKIPRVISNLNNIVRSKSARDTYCVGTRSRLMIVFNDLFSCPVKNNK
jgi:hypothetical protein